MADHKTKKKRGRSKLFTSCFRSFAVDERPVFNHNSNSDCRSIKTGRLGKPDLTAARGVEGDDVIPDVIPVKADVTGSGDGGGGGCDTERSSHGRSVSRLIKAVLFDSVMVKKICSSSKSSIASDTNEQFSSIEKTGKQTDDSNACGMESTDIEESSSHCSTLLTSSSRTTSSSYSSSSSSSTNSNSRWLSEQKTSTPLDTADSNHQISSNSSSLHKPNLINSSSQTDSISLPLAKSTSLPQSSSYHKQLSQLDSTDAKNTVSSSPDTIKFSSTNWNIHWCLFLLSSLIVLMVYGRMYAILCTSILFYLVPCRRVKRVNSVTNAGSVADTESEQYKKRVIMAGLLDRTRNPLR